MQLFYYKNKEIAYLKEGNGFPVVLLHGFAEDSAIWTSQTTVLKNHVTLIVPDLPGSGQSQILDTTEDMAITMTDYADCIFALLQQEGISSCVMLGHSMGGYIALAFAEKYPQLIAGFGFVHSTAFADSGEKIAVRQRAISTMEQYGGAAFIRNTTPNTFGPAYKAERPERIEALIEKGKDFTATALQQYYTAMMNRPDRTYVLANSKVPVLFIIGLQDMAVPPADALKQVHLPNEAHVNVLKEAGHMGMWEAEAEVNSAILFFVDCIKERQS